MSFEVMVLIIGIIFVLVASFCAIFGCKKRGNPMEHDLLKAFEREADKQAERNALNEAVGQIMPKRTPPFMPSKRRRMKDHEDFQGVFLAPPELQHYERATVADLPLHPIRELPPEDHAPHHHSDSHCHDSSSHHCDGGHDGGGGH